jgi:hypothetical protein
MAITGFPAQIKVTLGSRFNGAGNGLTARGVNPESLADATNHPATPNAFVLTKVSGQDTWTEDGTDVPDELTNRLRARFDTSPFFIFTGTGYGYRARIQGCRTYTPTAWASPSLYAGNAPNALFHGGANGPTFSVYNFKNLWAAASPTSVSFGGSYYLATIVAGTSPANNAASFNGSTDWAPYSTAYNHYKTLFSEMEEYVPSALAPDKTSYRYG